MAKIWRRYGEDQALRARVWCIYTECRFTRYYERVSAPPIHFWGSLCQEYRQFDTNRLHKVQTFFLRSKRPFGRAHHGLRYLAQYFMPKNTPMTKQVMTNICRTFHLAFKGMDADEIYDVMMSLLLRAALKYDPLYSEKVARVIEVIKNPELIGRTFTINDLNNHLDFDGARFVRVLCRNGFLEPLPEDGKPRRYRRKADAWRKRLTKFLHAGPVGFTYYLQMWFRYYLEMHIESAMGELSPDDKHTGTDRPQSDDGVALLVGPHPLPSGL